MGDGKRARGTAVLGEIRKNRREITERKRETERKVEDSRRV